MPLSGSYIHVSFLCPCCWSKQGRYHTVNFDPNRYVYGVIARLWQNYMTNRVPKVRYFIGYVSVYINKYINPSVKCLFPHGMKSYQYVSDVNFGMCGHSFGLHNHEISALAYGVRDVQRQVDFRWLEAVEVVTIWRFTGIWSWKII